MTRTISLPFTMAKAAAQAVLPHVSTDDVTPSLTVACIREDALWGTDRYSVGRYDLQSQPRPERGGLSEDQHRADVKRWEDLGEVRKTVNDDADHWDDPFFVPRAALQRIATFSVTQTVGTKHSLPYVRVTITDGETKGNAPLVVVALHEEGEEVFRQTFLSPKFGRPAIFPPMWGLLEKWEPQEEGTPTFQLMPSNLGKVTAFAGKQEPFKITAGKTDNPNKPAPMRIEVGERFTALLQPTLILR